MEILRRHPIKYLIITNYTIVQDFDGWFDNILQFQNVNGNSSFVNDMNA